MDIWTTCCSVYKAVLHHESAALQPPLTCMILLFRKWKLNCRLSYHGISSTYQRVKACTREVTAQQPTDGKADPFLYPSPYTYYFMVKCLFIHIEWKPWKNSKQPGIHGTHPSYKKPMYISLSYFQVSHIPAEWHRETSGYFGRSRGFSSPFKKKPNNSLKVLWFTPGQNLFKKKINLKLS